MSTNILGLYICVLYSHLSKKVAPNTPCLNHLDKNRLWILGQSLPGVTLYLGKIWSQWLHFCWIVQFGHCLWCLWVGFCVFKFSLNPLRTSLTRESDWKITTAKSWTIVNNLYKNSYFAFGNLSKLVFWSISMFKN